MAVVLFSLWLAQRSGPKVLYLDARYSLQDVQLLEQLCVTRSRTGKAQPDRKGTTPWFCVTAEADTIRVRVLRIWPGVTLIGLTELGSTIEAVSSYSLPILPASAVLAAIGSVILFAPVLRRIRRTKRGLCTECGYLLTGLTSHRCPECGAHVHL